MFARPARLALSTLSRPAVPAAVTRGGALNPRRRKHTLPDLPYAYDALEPVVSREIMEVHHAKHHAAYVNNLNATEEKLRVCAESGDVSGAIGLQRALVFNGGGHLNHSIFWRNLSPGGGGVPRGELCTAIERDFGSFDAFRAELSERSIAVQGSGWGWLGFDAGRRRLAVATCPNQDPLRGTTGLVPLLGIDVWEHAYYLQYRNVRPEYVKAIWDVVDWEDVAQRFEAAQQ